MPERNGARKQPPEETLYGTSHAAALVGCDPSTLRHYAKIGVISPIVSSTGRHVWRASDLRTLLAHRAGKPGCPAPVRGDELG